ncbi:hypothetical protein [Terrilactibacillus laevilacticus]|uniref:Uncharacterized protein n=1 Tax=Terrilactibacillus laevilacticus TaxID=1380157 RepID=A0ABW5PSL9_9BACI|nr:hypothetical protein [Terrilactibacillus laevilacticus]
MDFSHTWPYEKIKDDYYFTECPFCHTENVYLHLSKAAANQAAEGIKTHVIMPCCHEKIVIVEMDQDYIWSDQALR